MKDFVKGLSLIHRILIGMIIGLILGFLVPGWTFIGIFGELFISALKAIAPILVFTLIMASVSKQEIGTKTYVGPIIKIYLLATFLAAIVAVGASFIFPVKISLDAPASQMQAGAESIGEVLTNIVTGIVENPVKALMDANYLSLLFWAVLIGIGLKASSKTTKDVISSISDAVTHVVQMIISLAPIGIMGLVYKSIVTTGVKGLAEFGQLLLLLVGTMAFVALIVYPFIVFLVIKENPYPLVFLSLKESGIPAFFTRSSAANIPVNLEIAKKMGLTEESYAISLPLGAAISTGGAAITITIMTLAAVNTLNIHVSFVLAFLLSVIAALAACGASGIAGGSLLLIPLACSLFGISNDVAMQVVGAGFVIGVIQDSVETALNSSSDLMFTAAAEIGDRKKRGEKIDMKEMVSLKAE